MTRQEFSTSNGASARIFKNVSRALKCTTSHFGSDAKARSVSETSESAQDSKTVSQSSRAAFLTAASPVKRRPSILARARMTFCRGAAEPWSRKTCAAHSRSGAIAPPSADPSSVARTASTAARVVAARSSSVLKSSTDTPEVSSAASFSTAESMQAVAFTSAHSQSLLKTAQTRFDVPCDAPLTSSRNVAAETKASKSTSTPGRGVWPSASNKAWT
mmetsp:Transcript_6569/g.21191  ORF Transcript_6569/g.21191 Transcript_6569/m.21191 type:complete len:217 (+) Transcript_6569:1258-1908(+)